MTSSPCIDWVRTDRLGDVLCSLPSLWRLKQSSEFLVRAHVAPGLRGVLAPLMKQWDVQWGDHSANAQGIVFLNSNWEEMFGARRRGVPVRVGALSKWYSFVLLNHGVRQKRSAASRHEGEYSNELVDKLLLALGKAPFSGEVPPLEIPVCETTQDRVREKLKALGVSSPFWVLHPGMGGSAVNLSPRSYGDLARALAGRGSLLLSQGPLDQKIVEAIHQEVPLPILKGLTLEELREAFRLANGVVAPSTGPLHLAHWVGTATLGLYSPVQSQSQRRWAPRGGTGRGTVAVPRVECPARRQCLGAACPHHPCMDSPFWSDLLSSGPGVLWKKGEIHG